MRGKNNRERALQLRLRGLSYNEIASVLSVPKSTLRSWLGNVVLSGTAQKRLLARMRSGSAVLIKRNKMQTHVARQRVHGIRVTAAKRITSVRADDLTLAGALLYWAEGYKRPMMRGGKQITAHSISFLNSDAGMARLFIRFLREVLQIHSKDIVLVMRLYPHINEDAARKHWIRVTGLPRSNFRKSTNLVSGASRHKRPVNGLPYGTLQVAVYRTDAFYELMGLIDGVKKIFDCDSLS